MQSPKSDLPQGTLDMLILQVVTPALPRLTRPV